MDYYLSTNQSCFKVLLPKYEEQADDQHLHSSQAAAKKSSDSAQDPTQLELSVSANLKLVHIVPKHVHIGHVLVQTTSKMG